MVYESNPFLTWYLISLIQNGFSNEKTPVFVPDITLQQPYHFHTKGYL